MPHIELPAGLPGIRGPMAYRPETSKPLNELVEVLLRGPSTLTRGERELIATYVSAENDCYYCQTVHGAIAAAHLNDNEDLVRSVKRDFLHADVSEKMKALLKIAGEVQKGGKYVKKEPYLAWSLKVILSAPDPGSRVGRAAPTAHPDKCNGRAHSGCFRYTRMAGDRTYPLAALRAGRRS
jgi:AhpD family alkylhydroperoxidase